MGSKSAITGVSGKKTCGACTTAQSNKQFEDRTEGKAPHQWKGFCVGGCRAYCTVNGKSTAFENGQVVLEPMHPSARPPATSAVRLSSSSSAAGTTSAIQALTAIPAPSGPARTAAAGASASAVPRSAAAAARASVATSSVATSSAATLSAAAGASASPFPRSAAAAASAFTSPLPGSTAAGASTPPFSGSAFGPFPGPAAAAAGASAPPFSGSAPGTGPTATGASTTPAAQTPPRTPTSSAINARDFFLPQRAIVASPRPASAAALSPRPSFDSPLPGNAFVPSLAGTTPCFGSPHSSIAGLLSPSRFASPHAVGLGNPLSPFAGALGYRTLNDVPLAMSGGAGKSHENPAMEMDDEPADEALEKIQIEEDNAEADEASASSGPLRRDGKRKREGSARGGDIPRSEWKWVNGIEGGVRLTKAVAQRAAKAAKKIVDASQATCDAWSAILLALTTMEVADVRDVCAVSVRRADLKDPKMKAFSLGKLTLAQIKKDLPKAIFVEHTFRGTDSAREEMCREYVKDMLKAHVDEEAEIVRQRTVRAHDREMRAKDIALAQAQADAQAAREELARVLAGGAASGSGSGSGSGLGSG